MMPGLRWTRLVEGGPATERWISRYLHSGYLPRTELWVSTLSSASPPRLPLDDCSTRQIANNPSSSAALMMVTVSTRVRCKGTSHLYTCNSTLTMSYSNISFLKHKGDGEYFFPWSYINYVEGRIPFMHN